MKRISMMLAILLVVVTTACADNDKITKNASELPQASRTFLNTYFANIPISHIKIDKNLMWVESYDVILTDGTSVEFKRSGEWKEISNRQKAVPEKLLPSFIQSYVQQNYPTQQVISIDRDSRDFEVDLSNGVELKFDLKGNLLDIDM